MKEDPVEQFERECRERIADFAANTALTKVSREFVQKSADAKYTYNFTWLGRPIIQYPQDILAIQELIWRVRPEVIVETGIAHGGSLILSASILELLGGGEVLGVDIDIRPHNRHAITTHPLAHRISMFEGSSIDPDLVQRLAERVGKRRAMVILDSNHTHAHVRAELELYAPFVSVGSYLVVMDTVIEEMEGDAYPDRPWGKGDNPWTAVREFLERDDRFQIDEEVQNKLLITMGRDGYLRRVR